MLLAALLGCSAGVGQVRREAEGLATAILNDWEMERGGERRG